MGVTEDVSLAEDDLLADIDFLSYRCAGRTSLYRSDTNDYKWGSWVTKGIS